MASATPAGGGEGVHGGGEMPFWPPSGTAGIDGDGGDDSSSAYSSDDEEESLLLSMEQRLRLAQLWVANPSSSHELTHGLDGMLYVSFSPSSSDLSNCGFLGLVHLQLAIRVCSSSVSTVGQL